MFKHLKTKYKLPKKLSRCSPFKPNILLDLEDDVESFKLYLQKSEYLSLSKDMTDMELIWLSTLNLLNTNDVLLIDRWQEILLRYGLNDTYHRCENLYARLYLNETGVLPSNFTVNNEIAGNGFNFNAFTGIIYRSVIDSPNFVLAQIFKSRVVDAFEKVSSINLHNTLRLHIDDDIYDSYIMNTLGANNVSTIIYQDKFLNVMFKSVRINTISLICTQKYFLDFIRYLNPKDCSKEHILKIRVLFEFLELNIKSSTPINGFQKMPNVPLTITNLYRHIEALNDFKEYRIIKDIVGEYLSWSSVDAEFNTLKMLVDLSDRDVCAGLISSINDMQNINGDNTLISDLGITF